MSTGRGQPAISVVEGEGGGGRSANYRRPRRRRPLRRLIIVVRVRPRRLRRPRSLA